MPELYKFENLLKYLEEKGYIIKDLADYEPINVEFEINYKKGKIDFNNDLINYIDNKNKKHPGCMYQKIYRVKHWKNFPKKHICKCSVIQDYIDKNKLDEYYSFSTEFDEMCEIIDRNTKEHYEPRSLELCQCCKKELSKLWNQQYDDIDEIVKDLFEKFKNHSAKKHIKTDIYGYTTNWYKISEKLRLKKNYTCEKCGFKASNVLEKRFLEVHHIDKDKLNNKQNNLMVLCVECHAQIDEQHKKNYSSGINKVRLEQLREIKNNYSQSNQNTTKKKTKRKGKKHENTLFTLFKD